MLNKTDKLKKKPLCSGCIITFKFQSSMMLMNKIWFSKNLLFISTLLLICSGASLLASDDADDPEIPKEEEVAGGGSSKPGGDDDPDGQGIRAVGEDLLFLDGGSISCQGIPEPQLVSDQDRPRFKRHRKLEDVLLINMELILEAMQAGDWNNSNLEKMVQELQKFLGQIMGLPRDDSQLLKKRDFFSFCLVFLRQYLWHMPKELLSAIRLPDGMGSLELQDVFEMGEVEFEWLIQYILLGSDINVSEAIEKVDTRAEYQGILWQMLLFSENASEDLLEFCKRCLELDCFKSLVNVVDNGGKTPLHHAASHRLSKIVELLLNAGADVKASNSDGQTPLHLAAVFDYVEGVAALINANADINARDNCGQTPLHHAALSGHLKVVAALIPAGADLDARDNCGQTPMDRAVSPRMGFLFDPSPESHNYTAIIECLENAQRAQEAAVNVIFVEQVQLGDPAAAGYGQEDENPFAQFPHL
jgi:hypothetical protein